MGQVKILQRYITDIPGIGLVVAVIPCLHHHALCENILAVKEHPQRTLHLGRRPFPLVEHTENGDQHIGIVFDFIQIKMVLVIVVGAGVGIKIVLELRLQIEVGRLRRQDFPVRGWAGGSPNSPGPGVAEQNQCGRTGLHRQNEQDTGQGQEHAQGMPLHKAHRLGRQLFGGGGGLFSGHGPLAGGLLCPLLVLLAEPPFLPVAGQGIFRELRVFLGGGVKLIVRRSLAIPGLGPPDGPRRVLPYAPPHEAGALAERGLAQKLGVMGPLGAYIFLLYLVNLPMHKAVDGAPQGPARPFDGAGFLLGFLLCQLALCRLQLLPALFHTELGRGGLFLPALLPEFGLWDTLSRSAPGLFFRASPGLRARSPLGRGLLRAHTGPRASLIPPRHLSNPPGGWSEDRKSPHGGNDP